MVISVFLNPHTRSSLWFSVFLAWLLHPGRPATCEGLGMNEFYAPFLFPAFCHHLYHLHCCHSHPGHRHRLSELKESPGPCLYSHLAYLQPVSSTGLRVCTKFSSDQKVSSDATDGLPMDKITNLHQDLRSLISLTWPDPVSYRCPGSLCSGHPRVLAIPHDRLSHSYCRTSHRLFPQPEHSSSRCWWGSFFYLMKVSAKLSPHWGHYPSDIQLLYSFFPASALPSSCHLPESSVSYIYTCVCLSSLLLAQPLGHGRSINILMEWSSVALFLKWRQCSPSQDHYY